MRGKITVTGADAVARALVERGACDVLDITSTEPGPDMRGSGAVVAASSADLVACHRFAPAAVLVIAGDGLDRAVAETLEATLLPRTRVFGVATEDAARVAEAVVLERELSVRCAALCRGELGIEDRVAQVDAVVGAGGLRRIGLEPA